MDGEKSKPKSKPKHEGHDGPTELAAMPQDILDLTKELKGDFAFNPRME